MEIIHLSFECYPVAKAGGLGDVVGALPKYQNKLGHHAKVVMPMIRTKFLYQHDWVVDFKGHTNLADWWFDYTVIKEKDNSLGFDLYVIDIYGLLDRENIYGYSDDTQRYVAFQVAFVNWLSHWQHKPDVIHCHDYHVGLVPFMIKNCYDYNRLADIPTVLTIHNAQYQGWMSWDHSRLIPAWDTWKRGLLEWNGTINPLASAVKNAWRVTTVSWSYMEELRFNSNGLEALFEYERGKCSGVLNGIDADVWDPSTDKFIEWNYDAATVEEDKQKNKEALCKEFNLDPQKPLIIFIGRLVGEKAADLLPDVITSTMYSMRGYVNFLVLGSGEPHVEWQLKQLAQTFQGSYNVMIGYNEALSHRMYAGADFLLMPSRVEPCGLNQMYAMQYGTVPMVRSTGGLIDTVTDMGDWQGWGIRFDHASIGDIMHAISRAVGLYYEDPKTFNRMRKHMMEIDNSWEKSVKQYLNIYLSLKF
jgi:starch synthase